MEKQSVMKLTRVQEYDWYKWTVNSTGNNWLNAAQYWWRQNGPSSESAQDKVTPWSPLNGADGDQRERGNEQWRLLC